MDYQQQLCQAIEQATGLKMSTSKDFEVLSEHIFEKTHQTVSPNTLKRLWGYLPDATTPRISTLNILTTFLGYQSWDDFCQSSENTQEEIPEAPKPKDSKKWILVSVAVLLAVVAGWMLLRNSSSDEEEMSLAGPDTCVLTLGQYFDSYTDYLNLFGISDTTTYWGAVLPHHPNIVVWGPDYNHPEWHNMGDSAQMMPTITERWEPEGADSLLVTMRNTDQYNHCYRLNEVRITFMKNLVDTGYVFLGVYRLSLEQSDSTRCVWERVTDRCDLSRLSYLEELRN